MSTLRKLLLVLAALSPAKLLACAACYGGNLDVPMTEGMNWGIFTLLAIISLVLASFLAFLIYAIRKSEAVENARRKAKVGQASRLPLADTNAFNKSKSVADSTVSPAGFNSITLMDCQAPLGRRDACPTLLAP